MREYEQTKGMDALLFDSSGSGANNLDGPRPPGFVDFPQPPLIPDFQPFNYPVKKEYILINVIVLINIAWH